MPPHLPQGNASEEGSWLGVTPDLQGAGAMKGGLTPGPVCAQSRLPGLGVVLVSDQCHRPAGRMQAPEWPLCRHLRALSRSVTRQALSEPPPSGE